MDDSTAYIFRYISTNDKVPHLFTQSGPMEFDLDIDSHTPPNNTATETKKFTVSFLHASCIVQPAVNSCLDCT